jgi:serine/threonine protein kinase
MSDPSQPFPESSAHDRTPPGPPVDDEQHLQTLLVEWILLRDQGRNVSAAELCRDRPHLGAQLAAEIALHLRFEPTAPTESGQPALPVKEFAGLRYQPLRFHAQGGLGVVFVARDTEVGREVALKRIREQRQHQSQDRERFPREAEITGRLEHPGIVPVYGMGHDTSGHPYYTMRLVEGRTLAEAIEAFHQDGPKALLPAVRNPGLRALLNRFVAVCHTIGYAHSRGVIHRDLKPGNILLGDYGETLVIDWGLARQTDGLEKAGGPEERRRSPDASSGTRTGKEMGTRGFMSPEQARGDWVNVGPASDVFSLGATLYAILTGRAPSGDRSGLADAAAGKCARPRQVSRAVPPALEAVCLKALAVGPEERYTRALELAADVQRWLDDEPVQAYREPFPQRLSRWGRRHRTLVAAGFVLLTASVVGLSLGLWAVGRERERAVAAEEEAKQNLAQAEANLKLAKQAIDECFNVAKKHPLFQEPRMEQAKKLLLEKALPFYRNFRAQRPDDPGLKSEEAEQWFRVAFIEQTLGRPTEARHAYERARDLLENLVKEHPEVAEYQFGLASTHNDLGMSLASVSKVLEALQAYEQAADLLAKLVKAHPETPKYLDAQATTQTNLGNLLMSLSKNEAALRAYKEAGAIQAKLSAAHPTVPGYQNDLAATHNNQGMLLESMGKRAEGLQEYQQALEIQLNLVKVYPAKAGYQNALARIRNNRGNLLAGLGKDADALLEYEQAGDLQAKLVKAHPELPAYQSSLALTHNNRGLSLAILGKSAEALREYEQAAEIQTRLVKVHSAVPEYQNALARTHLSRGLLLAGLGKSADALQAFDQAAGLQTRLVQAQPEMLLYVEALTQTCLYRAMLLAVLARYHDALADLDRAAQLLDNLGRLDPGNVQVPSYRLMCSHGRAKVLTRLGRAHEADAEWERALALVPEALQADLRRDRTISQAASRARAGDYLGAAAVADELAHAPALSGSTSYNLACVLALSAAAAARDADKPLLERARNADRYACQAIALLQAARQDGYFRDASNLAHLDQDEDLVFLRQREDYRAFVKTLAPKNP